MLLEALRAAGMPGRPPIDGAADLLAGHMRRNAFLPQGLHEFGDVTILVGAQGGPVLDRAFTTSADEKMLYQTDST